MKLYSYFRSSAAFRVRIALNLKAVHYEQVPVNLREGAQCEPSYKRLNPHGLVPALSTDDGVLSQSLAIIEWLEDKYPEPALFPYSDWLKAKVRAMTHSIACDIHPLDNLRVLTYLKSDLGVSEDQSTAWYHYWIHQGFQALEQQVEAKPYCLGHFPTLADICLIPQVYNARRFQMDLSAYPRIVSIWKHCMTLDAFADAAPENQPDAV